MTDQPRFAQEITIDRVGQEFTFSIDGEMFPWEIDSLEMGPIDANSFPSITIRIPASGVFVADQLKQAPVDSPPEKA